MNSWLTNLTYLVELYYTVTLHQLKGVSDIMNSQLQLSKLKGQLSDIMNSQLQLSKLKGLAI